MNFVSTTPKRVLATTHGRLCVLAALYMVQGLPFGFQVGALPIFLREQGVGLAAIGYSTALAAPWALKIFWAPLVERFGGSQGSRIRWIVPLQIAMCVGLLVASRLSIPDQLSVLMGVLLCLNACAATQDIAVDGLAVDVLTPEELGLGNAAQVVGYKVGMLLAGGILVWASAWIGWSGAFTVMAVLVALVALGVSRLDESKEGQTSHAEPERTVREVLSTLWQSLWTPGIRLALAVVATYKMGESVIDVMYKPFLLDRGVLASQLGLWLGTWGMGASVLGSIWGGVLVRRRRMFAVLWAVGCFRLLPEVGQLGLAMGWLDVTPMNVVGISLAEHFVGGALTTVMFATMMGLVDRRIGATHFTLFACVEVWGKSLSALFSGVIAEQVDYAGAFGMGLGLGVVFLWMVSRLPESLEPNPTPS